MVLLNRYPPPKSSSEQEEKSNLSEYFHSLKARLPTHFFHAFSSILFLTGRPRTSELPFDWLTLIFKYILIIDTVKLTILKNTARARLRLLKDKVT